MYLECPGCKDRASFIDAEPEPAEYLLNNDLRCLDCVTDAIVNLDHGPGFAVRKLSLAQQLREFQSRQLQVPPS